MAVPVLVREVPCRRPDRGRVIGRLVIGAIGVSVAGGVAVAPRVMKIYGESKADIAKATVGLYAFEAYPRWAGAHPGEPCPYLLGELNEYTSRKSIRDPWGSDYRMRCDARRSVVVWSLGEDGIEGTDDDIRSER